MYTCFQNHLTYLHVHMLSESGTFSASEAKLKKSMSEIRGGVVNVLGKGESGKSGADGDYQLLYLYSICTCTCVHIWIYALHKRECIPVITVLSISCECTWRVRPGRGSCMLRSMCVCVYVYFICKYTFTPFNIALYTHVCMHVNTRTCVVAIYLRGVCTYVHTHIMHNTL